MKKPLLTLSVALSVVLIASTAVYALGTLTPTGTAGDDTQYSTIDIYNKLLDFTNTFSEDSGTMTVPGTVEAAFRTLTEIYSLLEAEETDLIPANIADGVTVFGVEGTKLNQLPVTGQTTSYYANDDGDLEKGISFSYTDNSDGTVTDNVTGLVWQQSGAYNPASWQDAIDYCANNVATLPGTGWRLPNMRELQSIVVYGWTDFLMINPIFTNSSRNYWSSTTDRLFTSVAAWVVDFFNSQSYATVKTETALFARCVR